MERVRVEATARVKKVDEKIGYELLAIDGKEVA